MSRRLVTIAMSFSAVMLFYAPASAAPITASCNAAFTVCGIPENIMLQLPFLAIAGDAVLTDTPTMVSDVFRIFNNVVNTGAGTGLGTLAFLYSSDDTALPASSAYSANVVFLPESPSGITTYTGNGTAYLLGAPEPSTFLLLVLTAATVLFKRGARMLYGVLSRTFVFCSARSAVIFGVLLFASGIRAQVANIDQPIVNLASGPVNVTAGFDLPPGTGPAQGLQFFAAPAGLAFYTAS